MGENITNELSTPSKSNLRDCHKNISGIYEQISPNTDSRKIRKSNGNNSFISQGTCVTSTPVNRVSIIQHRRSSSSRPKRHSLKPDSDDKRVDITEIIKSFEDNLNKNEMILNEIHMNYLKFKYSRLNRFDKDMFGNEEHIYMYSSLFNSNIVTTKFVDQTPLSNLFIVEHRYDCDKYVLKVGAKSEQMLLSLSSQRIIHEIRVLKLLAGHPHVVEYCDSWIERDVMHLQITYVSGGSLYDHINKEHKAILSGYSAASLLAQIGSVLVYLHEYLGLAHGAVTLGHILIELIGYMKTVDDPESAFSKCHETLMSENINKNVRFKLCDFSSCFIINETEFGDQSSASDILSFGLLLYQCFGSNLQIIDCKELPENFSESWRSIITNMCNDDLSKRCTARSIISITGLDDFILPEARLYIHDKKVMPINFLKPVKFEEISRPSSLDYGNYWIKSQIDDEFVDITSQIKEIEDRRCYKENRLIHIHENIMKFKNNKLNRFRDSSDLKEKCIYNYPFLYNSEVVSFKFSTQTLISETKLSMIYIANHRFDGDRYILKIGLPSNNVAISESSYEIINEMHILKLIGNHPNVVHYYDCWLEQEKFHLQLEFVSGGSLFDFLQGHFNQFHALSDVEKQKQKCNLSKQSAYILMAHVGSALAFFHDHLSIYHGDIKPSNILVELSDCVRDDLYQKDSKYYCHAALVNEEVNKALRFKLSDFGRSGFTVNVFSIDEGDGRYLPNLSERDASTSYHDIATSRDMYSLGLTVYDCFCGLINRRSGSDIRSGSWGEWPETINEEWRDIIKKLSHMDIEERWTAREVISLENVQPFVLPEALYHLHGANQYDHSKDYALFAHSTNMSSDSNKVSSLNKIHPPTPFDDEMDVSF